MKPENLHMETCTCDIAKVKYRDIWGLTNLITLRPLVVSFLCSGATALGLQVTELLSSLGFGILLLLLHHNVHHNEIFDNNHNADMAKQFTQWSTIMYHMMMWQCGGLPTDTSSKLLLC